MRLPSSSLQLLRSSRSLSTASYAAPLKAGQIPAYDQALLFLAKDKAARLEQLEELKKEEGVTKEVLEKVEVEAWVNDPETRWRAKASLGDMSKPVYRHLAERAWRKEGDLAILMQRVTQMSITPDLLPSISPIADVRIAIGGNTIVPGVFAKPSEVSTNFARKPGSRLKIDPVQTREAPEIKVQVYHAEERLYTLLMIDPGESNPFSFVSSFIKIESWTYPSLFVRCARRVNPKLYHLRPLAAALDSPNITLSSTSTTILPSLPAHLPYIPPHPQRGTPYHRYTFLLLAQSAPVEFSGVEREAFDTRAFLKEYGMEAEGPKSTFEKGSRFYLIFLALCASCFLSALDLTAVSTVLPTIASDLKTTDPSWVGSAYALTSTALIPWTGGLAKIFGRRATMLDSLLFFAIGSAVTGSANSMNIVILGRALQGVGGGGILTMTEIIVCDLIPLAERGAYFGILGSVWALASAIGPPIGGRRLGVHNDRLWFNDPFDCHILRGGVGLFVGSPSPTPKADLPYAQSAQLCPQFSPIIMGIGLGILYSGTNFPILAPLEPRQQPHAMAFFAFSRSFGQVIGIAIGSTILQNELVKRLPQAFYEEFGAGSSDLAYSSIVIIKTLSEPLRSEVRKAFADSLRVIWQVMIALAGLGLVTALLMKSLALATTMDSEWGLEERLAVADAERGESMPAQSEKVMN
ncbi:hypothetical protein P7C70_g1530, partial [Phenoliferia sp. Uapishka_3]